MSRKPARHALWSALLYATVGACTEPTGHDPVAVSIRVEPAEAEIELGERLSFSALVQGVVSPDVTWTVSGGTFTGVGGTIEWVAPSDPGDYTLTATSIADPSRSGSALVRVVATPDTTIFAAYRGTPATLPPGMFVTGENRDGLSVDQGYDPFTGISDFSSGSGSFDGFGAFTANGWNFSFGIRERGEADLREARLFLRHINDTDRYVTGFQVAYDVEVWQLGERANQIRLKLHTATEGFSQLPDIIATPNPRGATRGDSVGQVVEGSRPENRVRVSTTIDLATLSGPGDTRIGFLEPGDTAYFRWQYSNAEGDEGNLRSALAINRITIEPILSDDPGSVAREPLELSHAPGFHTGPIELELRSSLEDATIYYTTDGSVPDPARVMADHEWEAMPREKRQRTLVYGGPIPIAALKERPNDISLIPTNHGTPLGEPTPPWYPPLGQVEKGVVIRALALGAGGKRAQATATYFIAPGGRSRYSLPVVSLTTDRANFFSPEMGIYVPGDGPQRNYHGRGPEWERLAHLEFFEASGARPLAQDVGVRIHGGITRILPQKSLRIYARSEYGTSRLRHRFFSTKPHDDFNRIVLRNAGQDWWWALMRDAVLQTLVQHFPFDKQHYQPAIVFLNGEYWGIHNIRDRLDRHHLETHHGVPRDDVVILQFDGQLVDGKPGDEYPYREFVARVANGDFRSLAEVDQYMDVHGYLDYVISQMYAGNDDWPHTNSNWWRYTGPSRTTSGPRDGRWRWLMYDVDRSFGFHSTKHTDMVEHMLHPERTGFPLYGFELFRGLMNIREVREEFLQRTAVHLFTTFQPARVRSHIETAAARIEPEVPEHIARWRWPTSNSAWRQQVEVMLDFAADRPRIFRDHVVQGFEQVSGTATVDIVNLTSGSGVSLHSVMLDSATPGVTINGGRWSGRLFTGVPLVLRSTGLDLSAVEISGAYEELHQTPSELRFVLKGDAVITLP